MEIRNPFSIGWVRVSNSKGEQASCDRTPDSPELATIGFQINRWEHFPQGWTLKDWPRDLEYLSNTRQSVAA